MKAHHVTLGGLIVSGLIFGYIIASQPEMSQPICLPIWAIMLGISIIIFAGLHIALTIYLKQL